MLILICLPAGCRRPPPETVLLRYKFRPGEEITYEVALRGEGEVTMTYGREDAEEDRIGLPVRLEGSYLMRFRVDQVFPDGEAKLLLSYRDFDLTTVSAVHNREISVHLTDRKLLVSEAGRVTREVAGEDDDFPLRGVVGEEFEFQVNSRGTILMARVPEAPERLFPSLQFDSFLERMQPEFPLQPVPLGTSWSRTLEIPGPGIDRDWDQGEEWSIQLETTLRDRSGPQREIALLDTTGSFRQEISDEEREGRAGLLASSHQLSGTTRFDLPAGRVISSTSRLEQKLDIRIGLEKFLPGRNIDLRVDATVEVTVRLRK
ncbi:MAG: hypothetical protein APR56_03710 [Methanosaeta sp. SDB]|nr:MAG: hypothetical protein APR56_03710 [Methanosaeta sp. SDB]